MAGVGGASGVGGGEGINIPIMDKITNAYTTYPNSLIIRLSLRIKGNLSFIPISFRRVFYEEVYMIHTHSHVYNLNIELLTGFPDNFLRIFSNFTFQYLPAILRRKSKLKSKNFIPVKFSNGEWSMEIKYNIQFVIRNS